MSQCKVTSYYSTRKRVHESKILKQSTKTETVSNTSDKLNDHVTCEVQEEKTASDQKIKNQSSYRAADSGELQAKKATKKTEPKTKKAKPKTKSRTGKDHSKGSSTAGEGNSDIRKVFATQKIVEIKQENEELVTPKEKTKEVSKVRGGIPVGHISTEQSAELNSRNEIVPTAPKQTLKGHEKETEKTSRTEVVGDITAERIASSTEKVQTTPKRTLKNSESSGSPQKKLHLEVVNPVGSGSSQKKPRTVLASVTSPNDGRVAVSMSRKRLDLTTQSPIKLGTSIERSSKVTVTNLERSKFLNSGRLDTLKERLAKFDKSLLAQKEAENNKCKITSVISPGGGSSSQVASVPTDTRRTTPAAYERFHSLAIAGIPSLTLPYKYKWLSEMFRCSDTVVSILHNRKEICSFLKLKNSVQEMTKRSFTKNHLGQIKTVFPLAYFYTQEKFHSSSLINPKPGSSQYQLVIIPNLKTYQLESDEKTNENTVSQVQNSKASKTQLKNNINKQSSGDEQTSAPTTFVQMNPSMLVERKKIFESNLLKIVKQHHQDFLARLNPPITVPPEKLSRWHYRFPLDSVPDIEPSTLPEPVDVPKFHTAMDVLNKIKGTVNEKLEKALQSVAEKSLSSNTSDNSKVDTKGIIKTGFFKGISNDLLQRIRAREASKIVQEMTMPPEEKKREQMIERLPEMVRIIRNYFISARKAAISVQDATQKIMDSYHSALPEEDVRAHIQLLAEIFPKWLNLVTIPKGVFLKIDKNMDINIMIDTISKK